MGQPIVSDVADSVRARIPAASSVVVARRRFFMTMGLVFLVPIAIGFGPTFFLRSLFGTTDYLGGPAPVQVPLDGAELTIYPGGPFPIHLLLHGLALTAWYALFLAQTWLVSARRVAVHRRLGVVGVTVASVVVVTSAVTMIRAADRFATIGLPTAAQVGVLGGDTSGLVAFVCLVVCGVYFRRNAAVHKRCMFLAALSIIGPALSSNRPAGRMLDVVLPESLRGVGFGFPMLVVACVVSLVARDLVVHKRVQRATVGCILILVLAVAAAAMAIQIAGGPAAYVELVRSL